MRKVTYFTRMDNLGFVDKVNMMISSEDCDPNGFRKPKINFFDQLE